MQSALAVIASSRCFVWLAFAGAVLTPTIATAGTGNPYNFYASVADCAAAEQQRCDALGGGDAECTRLAENGGRGYSLWCINLALAIDTVATCTASRAPGCPRDPNASGSLATLDNNAVFLDDATCGAALDVCLATSYGTPPSGSSTTTVDTSGDTSCDSGASCDGGGDSGGDASCGDSSSDSSCDGGGDSGGDCGGGDSGGDCGGDEGSSCSDGSGDCDSSGGGGDCSAGRHQRHGGGLAIAIAWAFLPLPFASLVVRRGRRRRRRP